MPNMCKQVLQNQSKCGCVRWIHKRIDLGILLPTYLMNSYVVSAWSLCRSSVPLFQELFIDSCNVGISILPIPKTREESILIMFPNKELGWGKVSLEESENMPGIQCLVRSRKVPRHHNSFLMNATLDTGLSMRRVRGLATARAREERIRID